MIDVRSLNAKTGFFTHDPGFTSTSSCTSAITYIDGDHGILLHRGYAIKDLAAKCSFPCYWCNEKQKIGESLPPCPPDSPIIAAASGSVLKR